MREPRAEDAEKEPKKLVLPVEFDNDQIVIVDDRRSPWRNAIAIMTALLLFVSAFGWLTVQNTADDAQRLAERVSQQQRQLDAFADAIRDASVRGCQRQNVVRKGMRQLAHQANQGLLSISPDTAPSPETRAVIRNRRALRQSLTSAPCLRVYPRGHSPHR